MASITKREGKKGTSYLVRIRRDGMSSLNRTFKSKTAAQKWARKQETELDNCEFSPANGHKNTFNDLCDDYEKNGFGGKPDSEKKQISQLKFWREKIGNKRLCDVTPATICRYRRELCMRPTNRGDKTANSTANRYVSALSGALTYAVTI